MTREGTREAVDLFGAWREMDELEEEIRVLREFIRDVQLGVRELSEYEQVCGPGYL